MCQGVDEGGATAEDRHPADLCSVVNLGKSAIPPKRGRTDFCSTKIRKAGAALAPDQPVQDGR